MLGLMLLGVLAADAPAEPARWGLRWSAPAECRQAADVARAVEDRLKHPSFGPQPRFLIDGVVERAGGQWRARLTLVDQTGSVLGDREVTSAEEACGSIDARVTLVVALLIDPSAALRAPEQPKQAEAPPLPPPPPQPASGLFPDRKSTRVSLTADREGLKLFRVALFGSQGSATVAASELACEQPCGVLLPSGDEYYVAGDGMPTSRTFTLPAVPSSTVRVRAGSVGGWMGGLLMGGFGLAGAVGGSTGLIIGGTRADATLSVLMTVLTLASAGLTVGGFVLMGASATSVDVAP